MCMKQYAHRATGEGYITVDNLEPNPKIRLLQLFSETLVMLISLVPVCVIYLNIVNTIPDRSLNL